MTSARHSISRTILTAVLLLSCSQGEEPATRTEAVELRVDHEVIGGADSFAVIEPVYWQADIYGSLRDYEASLAPFTQRQRLMLALHWYVSEVNNGGHDQFYENSTGIVWPDALAALEAIEVQDGAAILRESASRLGEPPSRDRSERQKQLASSNAEFQDLDDRFYELQERHELNAAMLQFMQQHPEDFLFSGSVSKPVP